MAVRPSKRGFNFAEICVILATSVGSGTSTALYRWHIEHISPNLCQVGLIVDSGLGDTMRASPILALFLCLLAVLTTASGAQAYNVPGTGNLLLAPTTRIAANAVASSVRNCAIGGGSTQIAPGGSIGVDASGNFLRSSNGPLRYEYDMANVSTCFAQRFEMNATTLLFGAAMNFEHGNGKTEFNRGTLSQTGVGGSLFGSFIRDKTFQLFAAVGVSSVSYEMTRGGGTISGDFGSYRSYVSTGVANRLDFGNAFLSGVTDIRYVNARFSGYQEAGTAFGISAAGLVPSSSINMVLLTGEYRVGIHQGGMTPYLLSGFSHDFLRSPNLVLPTGGTVSLANAAKTLGFAGAGISSTFAGANFGIEGRYSIDTQHNTVLSVTGRLGVKF